MTSSLDIKHLLDYLPYGYVEEYQFDKHYGKRLFRADFCIPKYGLLIEFEGLSRYKTSRHTSIKGYSDDCEKYNIANILGFGILRYTQLTAKHKQLLLDITNFIARFENNQSHNEICQECKEELLINKRLWLKIDSGYRCLTCQWLIDDTKKKKVKRK